MSDKLDWYIEDWADIRHRLRDGGYFLGESIHVVAALLAIARQLDDLATEVDSLRTELRDERLVKP